MKASELIELLQKAIAEHGDHDFVVESTAEVAIIHRDSCYFDPASNEFICSDLYEPKAIQRGFVHL